MEIYFFSEDSRSQVWYRNLVIYCWSAHSPCYKPGCQTLTFTWLGACTRRVTTAQLMQKCLHLWDRTCESFAWKTRLNIIFTLEDFVPSRKGLENRVLLWDTDPHPLHLHPSPTAGPGTCQLADFFPLEWKFFPWAASKFLWHGGKGWCYHHSRECSSTQRLFFRYAIQLHLEISIFFFSFLQNT